MGNTESNEWLDKANAYKGKAGKKYDWVFDYAKFRLNFMNESIKYAEEKSMGLLRLVLSVAAASATAFAFFSGNSALDYFGLVLLGAAILLLICSGVSAFEAFNPTERWFPFAEEIALKFIDSESVDGEALAAFSLATADATEHEAKILNKKGTWVHRGVRFALYAIAFFILFLVWEVLLKTLRFGGHFR